MRQSDLPICIQLLRGQAGQGILIRAVSFNDRHYDHLGCLFYPVPAQPGQELMISRPTIEHVARSSEGWIGFADCTECHSRVVWEEGLQASSR